VDEYFEPVMERRGLEVDDSENSHHRNRSNDIWVVAQLGLAGAAYTFYKANSHIKIFCTIRREAFLKLHEYTPEHTQILGRTVEIEYDRRDFEEIFKKNIRLMDSDNLFPDQGSNPMNQFFGPNSNGFMHRVVDQKESAFNYIMRHTFYRPRDLMAIGGEIAKIPVSERTHENIKKAVERVSEEIVNGLYGQMRPFFSLPEPDTLFPFVRRNVLTHFDLEEITSKYLDKLAEARSVPEEKDDEDRHPFCNLYKTGMLGWIQAGQGRGAEDRQRFIMPREISVRRRIGLPATEKYYLIHPALDRMILERVGGQYLTEFHRANIVGCDLVWNEPATSHFVIKGDLCGFSRIMSSELYKAVAHKIHEWAEVSCGDLEFFEVSGGDSIVMIDKSAERIVTSTMKILKKAKSYKDHPVTFRFGASAGPIEFQEVKRRVKGEPHRLVLPLGLALRTSARLEPHAAEGTLMADDAFVRFSSGYANKVVCLPLRKEDVKTLHFDEIRSVFLVQKGPSDPPYETRLFRVELNDDAEAGDAG